MSLEDYRLRHAQYKTDPDLSEAHRQHPFIAVWDDHESANDAFRDGAENHQPDAEGDWQARKQRAIGAYFEWMPIRGQVDDSGRVYRSFRFGNLLDVILLDTRLIGRDRQVSDACDAASLRDPDRQLLGEAQENWFFEQLSRSHDAGTRWRVIGQQVMFGQLVNALAPGARVFNVDQWDGYAASRARVLKKLEECGIDNVVVLTGDIHSSWGMDITENPFDPAGYDPSTGAGSLAVEFVTPVVTSPGIEDPAQAAGFAALLRVTHPHIKFVELNRRGYALLDITPERVQAEWYHVGTIGERSSAESLAATLQVLHGTNHLVYAGAPSTPLVAAPPLAPVTVA